MEQRAARIDGKPVTTPDGSVVRAPYGGQVLAEVPRCTRDHIDQAVAAAKRTMHQEPMPAWRRASVLDRAAELLASEELAEQFARTIALEAAKPIGSARAEVARCVSTFRFSASVCRSLAGDVLPLDAAEAGEGRVGFTLRLPTGVVGAITPFNFPLNLVAHKVAPAIAAGCAVVLKPAGQTPLSAMNLVDLLIDRCGLPPGWLHVVPGPGSETGQALVAHDDVAMITFTGSPEVGWKIRADAPRKKVSLELGNNAPVIVQPDGDWRLAASKIATAGYTHAGQSCISVQRVLVHEEVAERFTNLLVEHVGSLVTGDPLDERTDVSTVIDDASRARIRSLIDEAVDGGAVAAVGGTTDKGGVLAPCVLTNARSEMRVCAEEVFGPVVSVQTYNDVDEAIRLANDTRYGLHAGIFTTDLATAMLAVRTLDFGGVIVNDVPTWRADQMPYGGLRDSGNTREGPAYTAREMTEVRTAVLPW
jgi:acyl-CoA reductase-like NAD-dependent aldehyde dehydrogenase